jgi:hypothetical protein
VQYSLWQGRSKFGLVLSAASFRWDSLPRRRLPMPIGQSQRGVRQGDSMNIQRAFGARWCLDSMDVKSPAPAPGRRVQSCVKLWQDDQS